VKAAPQRNGNHYEKNDSYQQEVPEKLHPSWEAKKKQQAISISNAPVNKKIKFD
jgi:hypothetical protein